MERFSLFLLTLIGCWSATAATFSTFNTGSAEKYIQDGQIVIEINGIRYNALGQEL